ncbi:hypothetical protein [Haloactinopolyspora sp.]|nr:hypothetical protein [Haloactinopolyspora sp.]
MSCLPYGRYRPLRLRQLRRWLVGPGQPVKGVGLLVALIALLVVPYIMYG